MKFIDLYAGIGGFRYALEDLGHECVFSAEKDKFAIETYYKNFPSHNPSFDMDSLQKMNDEEINNIIPDHDILTAGFPCQTFSIGGKKLGFEEARGTQFFNILKILKIKQPKYIFLENVKNIVSHDNGVTFKVIKESLKELGYTLPVKPLILSPEMFDIPHRRERAFMVAILNNDPVEISPLPKKTFANALENIASFGKYAEFSLSQIDKKVDVIINDWNRLIEQLREKPPVIWLDQMLDDSWDDNWQDWKKRYVTKMRDYYKTHKIIIDNWLKETNILKITNVKYRRLEWIAGDSDLTLKNKIITIRQSGVRVAKANVFPTLVASVETPIFYDKILKTFRYLSPNEVGRLQSFPSNFKWNENTYQAYKMFGNSVNIDVIKYIAKEMKWNL